MLKYIAPLAFAGLFAVAGSSYAADKSFTDQQTSAIENIVRDYLLNNPTILVEVSQKLQEQQQQQMQQLQQKAQNTIPQVAKELFSVGPIAGNSQGDVTLVEFFDYQCPHCKDMSEVIDQLVQQDPNLRVVYKEFPIFGRSSVFASKAALAANKQGKYDAFHDALMATDNPLTEKKVMQAAKKVGLNIDQMKKDMASNAVKEELNGNMKLGQQLGIMGTPAFIVGDTNKAGNKNSKSFFVPGVSSKEAIKGLVIQVRKG